MKFTLYTADCTGNAKNTLYPNQKVITSESDLKKAVAFDHVCALYDNYSRSDANFQLSDGVPMDCDNDHSDDPEEWITPEKLSDMLADVAYAITYSRHHMLAKGTVTARPRFHVFFPTTPCKDAAFHKSIKSRIYKELPFFDGNALDNTTVNSDISSLTRKSVSDLGFEKYDKARKSLDDILKNSTHVHGIHIDTNAINANTKIVIPNAQILGETKTSYSVPKACINFNLKESGKINFFAGSYYSTINTNSDSFFSLHHVLRTNNTTFSIKEISEIYQNAGTDSDTTPYVYKYTDNTYSSGTAGALVFNMSWLWGAPTKANALYYFEIPVNSGEYAMGAVKSGNTVQGKGAYLLYLDISANATIEGDSKFEEGEAVNPVVTSSAGTVSYSTVTTETVTVKTPPTYFPLALNDDGTDVSDVNTGYIISGANSTAGSPPGDIRVSRYNKNYTSNWRGIGNSLTNGSLDDGKIRTWNLDNANSGWQTVSQYGAVKLQKYLTSKEELQKVLDADANTTFTDCILWMHRSVQVILLQCQMLL